MDPYATLNVPDGADDAAIRAAYRKLAQKHHPDKGGDLHAFRDIQKAYDLIGTTEAREYFSLHGAEAPPFGQVESEALGQIASIFSGWLDAQFNGKPVVANPLEHVRMNLNSEIQAIDKAKHQVQKSLDKAHRLQGRFSTNGEVNVFEVRLNDVCEQAEKNLSEIAKAEERARTALALHKARPQAWPLTTEQADRLADSKEINYVRESRNLGRCAAKGDRTRARSARALQRDRTRRHVWRGHD